MQPADPQVQQQQQQSENVAPDLIAQSLMEQQQLQDGLPAEQLWESANMQQQQQQQAQQGSSAPVCNGAAAADHRAHMLEPNSSSNSMSVNNGTTEAAGGASDLLQQQGSQQLPATASPKLQQQQQQQRFGLPPLPPLPPQQPRSPLAGRLKAAETQQQNGVSTSSQAATLEADRATAGLPGRNAGHTAAAAAAGPNAEEAGAMPANPQQHQQQQGGDSSRAKPDGDHVQRPLFVPILVYMDEADHVLMQEEALSHLGTFDSSNSSSNNDASEPSAASAQTVAAAADGDAVQLADRVGPGSAAAADGSGSAGEGASTAAVAVSSGEALRRMRLLQEYLCAYEAQGLPVVKVTYGNFGEALDKLHEYILQCIKCAMTESGQL
jgi:hypothetical protein